MGAPGGDTPTGTPATGTEAEPRASPSGTCGAPASSLGPDVALSGMSQLGRWVSDD